MGDLRKGLDRGIGRFGWVVALATSIGLVALWLAPAARAASCSTNGAGTILNVAIASGQAVSVRVNSANTILVDGGGLTDDDCGGNSAGTVNTIDVNGAGGNETLTINNAGGGGAFDDDDDFTIDLAAGTDTLIVTGRSTADAVTFTPFASNGSDITQARVDRFSVFGGTGDDIVNGGTFAPALTISGGAGNDQLTGGNGNDLLNGGDGNDTINGSAGTDTLTYGNAVAGVTVNLANTTAQNTVGSGTDTITRIENMTGSPANDVLSGSSTANSILGGTGDDVIIGGDGDDSLNGADGVDTVSYSTSSAPVTVNLSVGSPQNTGAGTDLISNVESVTGGSGADTLVGTGGANTLTGGPGNDKLTGSDGGDHLDGGDGRDRAVYAASAVGVTVNLATGVATGQSSDALTSIENATGSPFSDSITGNDVSNAIKGGAGDDAVGGAGGDDHLQGGDGRDQLNGGAGLDRIRGGRGNDRGDAGGGNDLWKGGAGRDHIGGGAGRDAVRGGEGADILGGGSGNDHLNGGPGHDRCAGGPGNDTVVNCEH